MEEYEFQEREEQIQCKLPFKSVSSSIVIKQRVKEMARNKRIPTDDSPLKRALEKPPLKRFKV